MYLSNEEEKYLLPRTIENECLICYDIYDQNNNRPILFKKQDQYITSCHCNVIIHIKCLEYWYNYNKRCIICSTELIKQSKYFVCCINDNYLYNISYLLYRITNRICYISGIFFNVFCFIVIIYIMIMLFCFGYVQLLKNVYFIVKNGYL